VKLELKKLTKYKTELKNVLTELVYHNNDLVTNSFALEKLYQLHLIDKKEFSNCLNAFIEKCLEFNLELSNYISKEEYSNYLHFINSKIEKVEKSTINKVISSVIDVIKSKPKMIEIEYIDSKGNITQREIEEIDKIDNNMIYAFCKLRKNYRKFKLDNITQIYNIVY
jgi:predicted DNA-binding transcriptional regulator YafY